MQKATEGFVTPLLARGAGFVQFGLMLALWTAVPLQAADEEAAAAASAPAAEAAPVDAAPRSAARSPISSRVQLMTRELGLNPRQQAEVKTILEDQRSAVAKVWADPSVSSAIRVGATQAIGDKTADRIRAILSDEQRRKYIKPRQHEAPVGAPGGDVQKWMQTAQGLDKPAATGVKGK